MASRRGVGFRCGSCGAEASRWAGQCRSCGGWNTLAEIPPAGAGAGADAAAVPMPILELVHGDAAAQPTGVAELDRVLGGGLVAGSVTLVGGEPGIGKSTLALQMLARLASGRRCLLVAAEESASQVRRRAERLGSVVPGLWLVPATSLPAILAAVAEVDPQFLVVDSVHAVQVPELEGGPGSVQQVREVAARLVRLAKQRSMATLLVGHVTKEGSLAGPRLLEHLVDTVLSFEGDRHQTLRTVRAVKHRYGSTQEVGLFELTDAGLIDLPDPHHMFLGDRGHRAVGSAIVPAVDGHRPLMVEVQALVAPHGPRGEAPWPRRRSAQGVDGTRLALLLAVLERQLRLPLGGADVYASTVGGVRVTEPGSDLAVALAVVSSWVGRALPDDLVACGEIGLGAELRGVVQPERRLAEAARLGFARAIVPERTPDVTSGPALLRVATLAEALDAAGLDLGLDVAVGVGAPGERRRSRALA